MKASIRLESVSFVYPLFSAPGEKKRFPYRSARRSHLALDNVNCEIHSGTRLAVIGPNGAGKTTFLRVLAGIFHPSSGHVFRDGSVATLLDAGYGLDPQATGRQNAISRALLLGHSGRDCALYAEEIRKFADLREYFDQPVRTYSVGMVARLVFAISTQWYSDIVVLDEGLGAADRDFQEKASNRLRDWLNQAQILIFASHSKLLLESSCDYAIVVKHGHVSKVLALQDAQNIYPLE